jgi:polysaccharide export outer membrane protein
MVKYHRYLKREALLARILLILLIVTSMSACSSSNGNAIKADSAAQSREISVRTYPGMSTTYPYPSPMTAEAAYEGYTIGVNDILKISIWSRPELTKTTQVQRDGAIILPILGPVKVKGMSLTELQESITKMYSKYILNPLVDVEVGEYLSRQVYFIGEFSRPGIFPLMRRMSILEARAASGGVSPNANLALAYMLRDSQVIPVDLHAMLRRGMLDQNFELRDRDIVFIPSMADQKVIVIGQVRSPGIIQMMSNNFTIIEAISAAGGFVVGALTDDVKIIRGGLRNPEVISLDANKLFSEGRVESAGSIFLIPGDIVYVPETRLLAWNNMLAMINPSIQFLLMQPLQVGVNFFVLHRLTDGFTKAAPK